MGLLKFRLLTVISVVSIILQKERFYQALLSLSAGYGEEGGNLSVSACIFYDTLKHPVWNTLALTSHRGLASMKELDCVLSPNISYTVYQYIDSSSWAIELLKSMCGEADAVQTAMCSCALLLADLHKYCRPCWEGAPPSHWFGQFCLKRRWCFTDTKGSIFKHFLGL